MVSRVLSTRVRARVADAGTQQAELARERTLAGDEGGGQTTHVSAVSGQPDTLAHLMRLWVCEAGSGAVLAGGRAVVAYLQASVVSLDHGGALSK